MPSRRGWLALFLVGFCIPLTAQGFPAEALLSLRTSQGLTTPTWDPALARSAEARARVLASAGVLSHTDGQGRGPGLQMAAEGFPLGEFGEVLGAGADPDAVWRGWLSSPDHRAVLITAGWASWGAGHAETGTTTVWVLRFWKP